jgi:glycerophosphoryl diester phosphodiesterase
LPEETLEGYQLAIDYNADYIEMDVVRISSMGTTVHFCNNNAGLLTVCKLEQTINMAEDYWHGYLHSCMVCMYGRQKYNAVCKGSRVTIAGSFAQVSTLDGHLICRHDLTLDDSTDVQSHPEFSSRRCANNFCPPYKHYIILHGGLFSDVQTPALMMISWTCSHGIYEHTALAKCRWTVTLPSGRQQSGFFAANFTLQEVGTLYAKQAIPFRDQASSHSYRCSTPGFLHSLQIMSDQQTWPLTRAVVQTEVK